MAKWFVGQLVKIVNPRLPENFGLVGTIYSFDEHPKGSILADGQLAPWNSDCTVSYSSYMGGRPCATAFWQLEPILYDGAQPIAESFEEMMGKLREGVVA